MLGGVRVACAVVLLAVALAAPACAATSDAKPQEKPRAAAVRVLDQIVHNHYTKAWGDLHSVDQSVAPLAEYVG